MTFEELRQALIRLAELHRIVDITDHMRGTKGNGSDRFLVHSMRLGNPEQVTRDDIHREIEAIEKQVPEFAICYHQERGTGWYVLSPVDAGTLELRKQNSEE